MSTKIYNGYKFDRNYTLRELDEKLKILKKDVQAKANKLFSEHVIREFLYVFDYFTFFGKEKTLKLLEKYKYKREDLDWGIILFYITGYIEEKIQKSKGEIRRDFIYDYECSIHILPIPRKLLFLYYGEKPEFEKIVESQDYIKDYHYQNQTDRPETISRKSWKTREKDWEEAIIDYVPGNHGFTVELVNTQAFPLISKSYMQKICPELPEAEKRARRIAYDIPYKENMEPSDFFSKEYKSFLKEKTKEILKSLKEINSWEEIFEIAK